MAGTEIDGADLEGKVLLDYRECAWLARVHPNRWWGIAKRAPALRRARRAKGGRTFWVQSAVRRWVEEAR